MKHTSYLLLLLFSLSSKSIWSNQDITQTAIYQELETLFNTGKNRPRIIELSDLLLAGGQLSPEQTTSTLHKAAVAAIRIGEFEQAESYLIRFEEQLKIAANDLLYGKFFLSRGDLAMQLGQFDLAANYQAQAIRYFEKENDVRLLAHSYRFKSFSYSQNGQYNKALSAIENAKKYAALTERTPMILAAAMAEADIYTNLNDTDKALSVQLHLLKYLKENPSETKLLAQTYYAIGETYLMSHDYQGALESFLLAYDNDIESDMRVNSYYDLVKIGRSHMKLGQFQLAETAFENALSGFTNVNHQRNVGWALSNLGELRYLQGNLTQAQALLNEALEKVDEVQSAVLNLEIRISLAKVFNQLSQYQRVIDLLAERDNLSEDAQLKIEIWTQLSSALYGLGRFKEAFDLQQQARVMNRTVTKRKVSNHNTALKAQTQYQQQQIEIIKLKQIQILEKEQKKMQLIISIAVISILIVLIVGFVLFQNQRRKVLIYKSELLERSLKLKQQLLADVSHELRTPLTVLRLQVESLEYNLNDDPEKVYQQLHSRINMLNSLISDIYELAQADTGVLQLASKSENASDLMLEFATGIESVISQKELSFNAHINIAKEFQLMCDKMRLEQVFTNLARNSLAYTDEPGRVEFHCEIKEKMLVATLRDSSPSVKEHELPKLFERLYRCDKSRSRDLGGSGLGLSICSKLVSLHHGNIYACKSELGGIDMVVTLPIEETK